MKILFDHQAFTYQDFGGVSKYFSNLLPQLKKNNIEEHLSLYFSNNENLDFKSNKEYSNFFKNKNFKGKSKLMNLINIIYSSLRLFNSDFNVFHLTYYNYYLPYNSLKPKKTKIAVTVYDMNHELFPELFPLNDKTSLNKKKIIDRADIIFAISESTKNDLIKIWNIDKKKIFVTHLNATINRSENQIIDLPEKYILFVGHRDGYKNFLPFLKSILTLLEKEKDLKIVCLGGGGFKENEKLMFKNNKIENRILLHSFSEKKLYSYYKNAVMFVYPSLYEGFGLPILEAFDSECACVLSNTSSLPEVGGNAAAYFNPKDSDSILQTIEKVYYDKEYKQQLIKFGSQRKSFFSWEKCASETIKGYESIL